MPLAPHAAPWFDDPRAFDRLRDLFARVGSTDGEVLGDISLRHLGLGGIMSRCCTIAILVLALVGCSSPEQTANEKLKARVKPFREAIAKAYEGGLWKVTCDEPILTGRTEQGFTGMIMWVVDSKIDDGLQAHDAHFVYSSSDGVWRLDHLDHRITVSEERANAALKRGELEHSTLDEFSLFTPSSRGRKHPKREPPKVTAPPGADKGLGQITGRGLFTQQHFPPGSGTIADPYVARTSPQELEALLSVGELSNWAFARLRDETSPWHNPFEKPPPRK